MASVTYNDVDHVFCTAGLGVRLFVHLDGALNHVITLSFGSLHEDARQFLPGEFFRFENIGKVKLAVEPVRSYHCLENVQFKASQLVGCTNEER